jgi:hypothetical protein
VTRQDVSNYTFSLIGLQFRNARRLANLILPLSTRGDRIGPGIVDASRAPESRSGYDANPCDATERE